MVAVEFASARLLEERDLLQRKSGLGLRRVKIPKKRIAWEFQTGCRGDATYSLRLTIFDIAPGDQIQAMRHDRCLFGCPLQPLCKSANAGDH